MKVFLEADAVRVGCREHGVVAAAVPRARHGAGHTLVFDQQVAWMAAECSKSAVAQLMRTSWRTVGAIVERFVADRDAGLDRLAGLRRIGIDEISYRKGQRYMTVVVDHDTRRVVWMADGHGKQVLQGFFDALGPERAAKLTHISADGAEWIAETVDPPDHPPRLRLPHRRHHHRPRHAHPRRRPPHPSRTPTRLRLTHTSSRRASKEDPGGVEVDGHTGVTPDWHLEPTSNTTPKARSVALL